MTRKALILLWGRQAQRLLGLIPALLLCNCVILNPGRKGYEE